MLNKLSIGVTHRWLHYNTHLSSLAGDLSHHDRCQWGRCRARLRSPPRTEIQKEKMVKDKKIKLYFKEYLMRGVFKSNRSNI